MARGTLSANGNVDLVKRGLEQDIHTISAQGTWGSGTLTVYIQMAPDLDWMATDAILTADGFKTIAGRFAGIRAALTGSTNPSLTVVIL